MDIEFYDSFNGQHVNQEAWITLLGAATISTVLDSGHSLRITGNVGFAAFNTEVAATKVLHCFFQLTAPGGMKIFSWLDSGLAELGSVRLSATQLPEIWIGTGSATYTGTTPIQANVPYHMQLKLIKHASTGTAYLKIDGNNEIVQTGVNTGSAPIARIQFTNHNNANQLFIDSLVVDRADFLGIVRMVSVNPEANGDLTVWTPNTGTIAQCVDDAAPDGDTTYVESTVTGDQYLVRFPAFSLAAGVVPLALCYEPVPKKISSGQVKHLLQEGGNLDVGSAIDVATAYRMQPKIYVTNPRTAAAWALSDLTDAGDKIQAGLESVI